jgi:hypothetical protein
MNHLDRLLAAIAREHLGVATLKTRHSDALDFHDISVCGIKRALTAAYQAGLGGQTPPPDPTPDTHTPEPWAQDSNDLFAVTADKDGLLVAVTEVGDRSDAECEVNARRIAAAVNACAGIPISALEQGAVAELLEALDYLLAQTVDMDLKYGIGLSEGEEDARAKALAVIAQAKGGAQ